MQKLFTSLSKVDLDKQKIHTTFYQYLDTEISSTKPWLKIEPVIATSSEGDLLGISSRVSFSDSGTENWKDKYAGYINFLFSNTIVPLEDDYFFDEEDMSVLMAIATTYWEMSYELALEEFSAVL